MQIIRVEGYVAFHGTMLITPKDSTVAAAFYIKDKDWLYKPNTECWYGDGRSFSKEICTIVED